MTINPTTAVSPPAGRSLREILAAARMITCGQCWQAPGGPCGTARQDRQASTWPGWPARSAAGWSAARS